MIKAGRKSGSCALCESPNLASICPICVNYRLNEYSCHLRLLKSKRDALYSKLAQVLVAKGKADDQHRWRVLQNERLTRLRDNLRLRKEQVSTGKAKTEKISHDLKVKYELLESAKNTLEKNQVDQLEKYFPNLISTQKLGHMAITSERLHKQSVIIKQICKLFPQRRVNIEEERKDGNNGDYDCICNARLPRGLDPHSVPSAELAASLGYMVQLINLLVNYISVPALHNSGFAGSCSRIWQRDSYWDARPSSRCEYPLFIPRQKNCSTGNDTSWSEKSSSSFGVASMESERRPRLDSSGSSSFKYSSASHSVETHKDLQKGISLLKKSVACITAYCYNSLSLKVPQEVSTFEAFARLLDTLSSSKEVRAVLSLRTASSRSPKQGQQLNKSVWNVESAVSASRLIESAHGLPVALAGSSRSNCRQNINHTSSKAIGFVVTKSRSWRIEHKSAHASSGLLTRPWIHVQLQRTTYDNYLPSSAASFLYGNEFFDMGKSENLIEGWDIVEHDFPPPPSQNENVEHWIRAMFIDATKR